MQQWHLVSRLYPFARSKVAFGPGYRASSLYGALSGARFNSSLPTDSDKAHLPIEPSQSVAAEQPVGDASTRILVKNLNDLGNSLEAEVLRSTPLLPLPALPRKPRYPCPHLTPEEAEEYLVPLFKRNWAMRKEVAGNAERATRVLELAATFRFPKLLLSTEFINDTTRLIESEKHHPTITTHNVNLTTIDVHVRIHTHTAIRSKDEGCQGEKEPDIVPGVTLRDVRLAFRIQELFESYQSRGRALRSIAPSSNPWREYTEESSQAISPQRKAAYSKPLPAAAVLSCTICKNGFHRDYECPNRFTNPPPGKKCSKCQSESHWEAICEVNNRPSIPCRHCGGDHWHRNCRQYHCVRGHMVCRICGGDHPAKHCLWKHGMPLPIPSPSSTDGQR